MSRVLPILDGCTTIALWKRTRDCYGFTKYSGKCNVNGDWDTYSIYDTYIHRFDNTKCTQISGDFNQVKTIEKVFVDRDMDIKDGPCPPKFNDPVHSGHYHLVGPNHG